MGFHGDFPLRLLSHGWETHLLAPTGSPVGKIWDTMDTRAP